MLPTLSVALIFVAELALFAAITKIVLFTGTALAASVIVCVPLNAVELAEPATVGAVPEPSHVNVLASMVEALPPRSVVVEWIV